MTVVELTNVSKAYRSYAKPTDRLREILFRRSYGYETKALDSVSLKVKKGEALGVVGENGAGKSTLLSIIAGIVYPTEGTVNVRGRVSAILELGAGFHQEFTGMENIYMYASLQGIPKKEIDSKLDFIREFSELGEHLNHPIKTYSTGMVMRLAVSVMVALEPDIFIIDEALSVGDIHFQKKSFDRIRTYIERGGTVIFTSHSTYQITNICNRAIWLKQGRIELEGDPFTVVKAYEDYMREKDSALEENPGFELASGRPAWIEDVNLSKEVVEPGDDLSVRLTLASKSRKSVNVGVVFRRNDNVWVSVYSTKHEDLVLSLEGKLSLEFIFDNFPLLYGKYYVDVYLLDETAGVVYDVKSLNIDVPKRDVKELGIVRIKGRIVLHEGETLQGRR